MEKERERDRLREEKFNEIASSFFALLFSFSCFLLGEFRESTAKAHTTHLITQTLDGAIFRRREGKKKKETDLDLFSFFFLSADKRASKREKK